MRYVYILRCIDQSLYTGITTDLVRRVQEHNTSPKWAKYTSTRRPVYYVWSESFISRLEASRREYQIKKMTKINKEKLILS